jgi:4-amino-4-deoxy-L-arabinose transferase-like glycosyltransferase
VSGLPTTFRGRLTAIAGVALGVRILYVVLRRGDPFFGDALIYWLDAQHVARGEGFRQAFVDAPTAEHPPLHIALLALQDLAGINGYESQKILFCFVGAVTVVLIALLARHVAGERAGLLAGALAAIYPNLVMADGSLMSETLYLAFLVLALITSWRLLDAAGDTSRPRLIAAVGALAALAALTRAEAVALVPLLVLPCAWRAGDGMRRRATLALVGCLAFAAVLAPWTIRNLRTFEEPVLISNNGSAVAVGANCERTYYGDLIGSWAYSCFTGPVHGDESQVSVIYRERGLRYARDHLGRLPLVVAARAGRALEVYRPGQNIFLQSNEGRGARTARVGVGMFWLLIPLAIAGVVLLRRRGRPIWILVAPIAMATFTCLAVYGSTRLRVAAEPSLVVLAAVTLDELMRRRPGRPDPIAPAAAPRASAPAA